MTGEYLISALRGRELGRDVDALHAPAAGDYPAIFRAHDSELLPG